MAIWLDLKELAEYLKLPASTVYRLAQRKVLPGHKIGRAWRFDRDEVDAWIRSGGKAGPATHEGSRDVSTRRTNKAS